MPALETRRGKVSTPIKVGDTIRFEEYPRGPIRSDKIYFRNGSPYSGEVVALYTVTKLLEDSEVEATLSNREEAPEPFTTLEYIRWGVAV